MKSQPNILVYSSTQANAYKKRIQEHGFTNVKAAATPVEAERYLPNTEIILGWKFPTYLLGKDLSSTLRWYQSMGAGVDDLVTDKSIPESIILTRILDQFGGHMSEYVFTYLLYIVKDVHRMLQSQMVSRWDPFISDTLAGKTIGIAGIGSIGAEMVRKARAFDMKVYGLSFSSRQTAMVDRHFTPDKWQQFVEDLDVLVLTLPLTEDTRHVLNKDILLAMKRDAILVNVGRGALIKENDLVSVMQEGHLQAAVLDVFETEPLPKDHPFYSMANVYVTSHLSGPSTVDGVSQFFIENVNRYVNGQPLEGLVYRHRGY